MPKFQQLLANADHDKQLWEKGYVILPLLNQEEVKELYDFYIDNHKISDQPMAATAHDKDIIYRQKMNNKIDGIFHTALAKFFRDTNFLGGTYVVKGKGKTGKLDPHMDWNIVDEREHRSFNIWVPLVDSTKDNGGLQILEGSHNKFELFRGANIDSPFYEVYSMLWDNLKTVPMKAGEAICFDHRLIHASGENKTDQLRVAIVYGIMSDNAKMYYYYKKGDEICEYNCSPEFYMNENAGEGPIGLELNRSFKYGFPLYNHKEVAKAFDLSLPKISFFNKVKQLFN